MKKCLVVGGILTIVLSCFFLAGCGGGGEEQKPQGKVVIGVSLLTRTHPFYQDLEAGLKREAERLPWEKERFGCGVFCR